METIRISSIKSSVLLSYHLQYLWLTWAGCLFLLPSQSWPPVLQCGLVVTCFDGQHVVGAWQLPLLPSWNEQRGLGEPGWGQDSMWMTAGEQPAPDCMSGPSWARPKHWPTEPAHPFPHTHTSQDLGVAITFHFHQLFLVSAPQHSFVILAYLMFPWFSGLMLTWPLPLWTYSSLPTSSLTCVALRIDVFQIWFALFISFCSCFSQSRAHNCPVAGVSSSRFLL